MWFLEEGKEYYPNGKLLFKGKYKCGIKWDGEGCDPNGNKIYKINNGTGFYKEYEYQSDYYHDNKYNFYLVFEGEYLNGEKHGKGRNEYDEEGEIIFEGEYHEGKRWNGKGKGRNEYDVNGIFSFFEGEYH